MTPNATLTDSSLAKQTLRTVALLVGACVLFVGALSLVAVAVTSRALGGSASEARSSEPAAPGTGAKKPLSI
jgi:hypothetical protein